MHHVMIYPATYENCRAAVDRAFELFPLDGDPLREPVSFRLPVKVVHYAVHRLPVVPHDHVPLMPTVPDREPRVGHPAREAGAGPPAPPGRAPAP